MKSFLLLPLFLLLLSCSPSATPQSAQSQHLEATSETTVQILAPDGRVRATYSVEVADTPLSQEKGLMNRTEPLEGTGMLFVFEPARAVEFWMRDTRISLDMLFIDEQSIIQKITLNARPCPDEVVDCPHYPSTIRTRYVLEVDGGESTRRGLEVGDRLLLDVR